MDLQPKEARKLENNAEPSAAELYEKAKQLRIVNPSDDINVLQTQVKRAELALINESMRLGVAAPAIGESIANIPKLQASIEQAKIDVLDLPKTDDSKLVRKLPWMQSRVQNQEQKQDLPKPKLS